jgi:pimeloyl-ACP methyl ester carboxylesterase
MVRLALLAALLAGCMPPSWGANALLHPPRRSPGPPPALPHRDLVVEGGGPTLRGWVFPAEAPIPGAAVVVYLHGVGDDRTSGTWIAGKLVRRGLTVVTFDARAHGASEGAACTYGVLERGDLTRLLDALGAPRAVLLGVSLGAAVALQAATADPRVVGVVAVAPFADLEAIARERAPWFASEGQIREALALVAREGGFDVAEASPVRAAGRLRVPVLLVHGDADRETRPEHSRRIFAALAGPRRLLAVRGAGHDDALGRAWGEVEGFVRTLAAPGGAGATAAAR